MGIPQHKLIQDVSVSLKSFYHMISSLLEQRWLSDPEVTESCLTVYLRLHPQRVHFDFKIMPPEKHYELFLLYFISASHTYSMLLFLLSNIWFSYQSWYWEHYSLKQDKMRQGNVTDLHRIRLNNAIWYTTVNTELSPFQLPFHFVPSKCRWYNFLSVNGQTQILHNIITNTLSSDSPAMLVCAHALFQLPHLNCIFFRPESPFLSTIFIWIQ